MSTASEIGSTIVRPAKSSDAPEIAQLSAQLGYPTTTEDVTRRLRQIELDTKHVIYVVELHGGNSAGFARARVIGWIHVQEQHLVHCNPRAEVLGLVVDGNYRSRGAGRALMRHAEEWARSRGCLELMLRSNIVRTRAHSFYEAIGYELVKTSKTLRKIL